MKKKIAMLMAFAMVFSAVAPVYGAEISVEAVETEAVEATEEILLEPMQEGDEVVVEESTKEKTISDSEEGEEAFPGKLADIEEVVTQAQSKENSEGTQAATSIYFEGASFGRQSAVKQLNGAGVRSGSYSWSWASPEYTSYYTDAGGKLHIVAYNSDEKQIYDAACDSSMKVSDVVKVSMPLPKWGGFYAAPDGNFYVVVGQENLEESTTKIVAKILKYNSNWSLLGTTDIPGGISNAYKGIYIPFDAASLHMTLVGSTLIVHTGREMFAMDQVHHQSNISFIVNTQTMQLMDSSMPYVSHSFNQFVVNDGDNVYFLDHGDAYDRGLILSRYSSSTQGNLKRERQGNIFPFMGEIGGNYTGCQVTGFALEGNTLITIGKSVPHSMPVNGETGYSSQLNQNIFMILTDKNTFETRYYWITQYPASGNKVELTEPKLVRAGDNRYAILYSEETSDKSILHYILIDSEGNQLVSKKYENVTIQTDSQPILFKNSICWVSGNYDNGKYDSSTAYLYKIPVVTVPLTGISLSNTELKLNEGSKKKLVLSFSPTNTNDVKDVQWTSSNTAVASVSSDGTVTAKGYGKAVVTARSGQYKAQCTVTVNIPASDKPLSTPVLNLSQTRADKMRLSWKKVTGAKGYQIYYKTSSKAAFKHLVTIKNAAVSYDASVDAGKTYYFKVRAYGTKTDGKNKYSKYSATKSKKAIVPVPSQVTCDFGSGGTVVSWSKVTGASGYVVYRNGKAAKFLKASQATWKDTSSYISSTGMYWIYNYYVRAYRIVDGKRVYSGQSKVVNL